MEKPPLEIKSGADIKKVFTIGCLLLTLVVVLIGMITLTIIFREQIPVVKNYFPSSSPTQTLIPTSTPIPHILVHRPSDNTLVLNDVFTTNDNDWSSFYSEAKVEVQNGKLAIESFASGDVAIAYCSCKSSTGLPFSQMSYADKYYLQADISTEKITKELYGLVFGLSEEGDYYEFSINPTKKRYYLDKKLDSDWLYLVSGSNQIIKAYPEVNTLSIYFDHGTIELFVNGEKVAVYVDKSPINKGEIGFMVDDFNFKLLVDNLFAYNAK